MFAALVVRRGIKRKHGYSWLRGRELKEERYRRQVQSEARQARAGEARVLDGDARDTHECAVQERPVIQISVLEHPSSGLSFQR